MTHLAEILERSAERRPESKAIIFDDDVYTYEELNKAANRMARLLDSHGVRKGDRVVLDSANSPGFVIAAYGILKLGALLVAVNPQSTPAELAYFMEDSQASALLFHPKLTAPVAGYAAERTASVDDGRTPVILSLGEAEGFEDAIAASADLPDDNLDRDIKESDLSQIIYTSGTTGNPKGAVLDHRATMWTGFALGMGAGFREGDTFLLVAPLYHSAPLNNVMFPAILAGGTLVIRPTFDPVDALESIEEHKCDFIFCVPTMLAFMVRVPNIADYDLTSLRTIYYGAAPMPQAVIEKVIEAFPNARLVQGTGLTEGGPGGAMLNHEEILERPWASGRAAMPAGRCRIVDPDGNEVGVGEVGEMIIQSESMMRGYWNKPEKTAEAIRDGWLHTGDLARVEDDGFFTLVDRMKDMIISGGRNIYSAEVENAISGHPGVLDVAVVGELHEIYGETVVAVIVPTEPENPPTLESIREHAEKTLSHFKLPRKVVIREIPRNPSGKILKHRLRDELRAEAAQAAGA